MRLSYLLAPITKPRVFWGCTWRRIRAADVIDWLFAALFLVVGLAVGSLVYAFVIYDDAPEPWGGLTYVEPAAVIDRDETIPQVEGYDPPAVDIEERDFVTIELTRVIDCAAFDCPEGSIPFEFENSFTRQTGEGQTDAFEIGEEAGTSAFHEGAVYTLGKTRITSISFDVEIPGPVRAAVRADGPQVWSAQGIVEATAFESALPAFWISEPITLVSEVSDE